MERNTTLIVWWGALLQRLAAQAFWCAYPFVSNAFQSLSIVSLAQSKTSQSLSIVSLALSKTSQLLSMVSAAISKTSQSLSIVSPALGKTSQPLSITSQPSFLLNCRKGAVF